MPALTATLLREAVLLPLRLVVALLPAPVRAREKVPDPAMVAATETAVVLMAPDWLVLMLTAWLAVLPPAPLPLPVKPALRVLFTEELARAATADTAMPTLFAAPTESEPAPATVEIALLSVV